MNAALLVLLLLACPLSCVLPALLARRPRDQGRVTTPAVPAARPGPGALRTGAVDDPSVDDVEDAEPRRRRRCC